MRFATTVAAGLACILFNGSNAVANDEVAIMSFNVRTSNAQDPCPSGCWKTRTIRVQALVQKYMPDIIGTQESAPDQTAFFESVLGFAGAGECSGDCQTQERNSIFYRPERWQLLNTATYALSDTPQQLPSNTWNLQYLRSAVLVRLQDKHTMRVVCMLNTHFDMALAHPQSAILVAKLLSQFCQPDDSAFLTGDLNTPPSDISVQYLLNQAPINEMFTPILLYETLTAAGQGGYTWIGPSFGSQTSSFKFDYIFARHDDHTCLRSAMILTDLFDGYSSSDHAALLSKFCLGRECQTCIA